MNADDVGHGLDRREVMRQDGGDELLQCLRQNLCRRGLDEALLEQRHPVVAVLLVGVDAAPVGAVEDLHRVEGQVVLTGAERTVRKFGDLLTGDVVYNHRQVSRFRQ